MQSLGLLLILLQFLSGSVSDTQSHLLGVFNIFSSSYSSTSLATGLNSIIGPIRHTKSEDLELGSRAAIIIDNDSGKILYAKSPDDQLPMASITKLMTAVVALDNLGPKLDSVITVPADATRVTGSDMNLIPGEKMTARNLLKGMLVASANDAAATLAATTAPSTDQFVTEMNQKASELGLLNTHFMNPTGFDSPDHYSTAADLAKLTQYVLKNPILADIVDTQKISIADVSKTHVHALTSTNELLGKNNGVIGVKTGTTTEAGPSLIAAAIGSAGQKVIVVLLDSPDRFGEGKRAIDWALNNYSWIEAL